jgi:tetratricopeptide (TPR) repeat protein
LKLEGTPIPRDRIVDAFENAINQLIELRSSLERQENGDETIRQARIQADKEVSLGDFGKAKETLERARLRASEITDVGRRTEAEILESQANLDLLQFRYREAGEKFAHAAKLLSDDTKATFDLLAKRAAALQDLGELFGDDDGLTDAVIQWEEALSIVSERAYPFRN